MAIVIDPIKSIKDFLDNQTRGLDISQSQQHEIKHETIINGAANVLNCVLDADYCWNQDYGKVSILEVILRAIERVEQDYDCYGEGKEENKRLLLKRLSEMTD